MKARMLAILLFAALSLALTQAQSASQEYIVAVKQGRGIGALNKSLGIQTVRQIPNTSIYLVTAPGDSDTVVKNLKSDSNTDIAEKNGRGKLTATGEAAFDPAIAQQMASLLDGQTLSTFYGTTVLQAYVDQPAIYLTHLNEARSLSTGAATQVAYIDTGADYTHPALQPWLAPGIDLVSNQTADEALDDSLLSQQMASLLDQRFSFVLNQAMASLLDGGGNTSTVFPSALGHGTLVAGIIHLVAPQARIVPIKAFDAWGNTTMFTIVEGLYRARDLNVDVVNMSFSTDDNSDILKKAVSELQANGTALIAAVGNDASDVRRIYPASYPQVIGVTATDFSDRLASFANYGKSVSVAAPGAGVVSTAPGGRYAAAWGTSFSAPIVSGVVALVASGHGHGQSDSHATVTTADSIDSLNPGFEKKIGSGRINAQHALKGK